MKKFITAIFCTALALSSGLTAYAAEAPDRESLETAIWEDLWNGKGDNGARAITVLNIPKHRTSIICLTSGLTRTTAQADMTGPMWERSNTATADTTVI